MSQSCLQDDDTATEATSLVEGWCKSDSDKSLSLSFLKISFLEDCTMEVALSGSWRHLAKISVPSWDSSILHCWTMDVLKHFQWLEMWKILEHKLSLFWQRSLLRKATFLRNMWVDTEDQWRPIWTAFPLVGEGYGVQFHIGSFQELPERRSQVARFHNCRVILVGHAQVSKIQWMGLDLLGKHSDYPVVHGVLSNQ